MTAIAASTYDLLTAQHPMLAEAGVVPLESLAGSHYFDQKLDGIRALAAWDAEGLMLRNRNGRDISLAYPDLEASAPAFLRGPVILDGEIVAASGSFQDIAKRDRARTLASVAAAIRATPAVFAAFDVLWHPERGDLRHLPAIERREALMELGLAGKTWRTSVASADPALYDQIRLLGGEGVVAKRKTSRYQGGRRPDWLKYKSKHSVTCIGIGYEPGNGSRAQFGAMLLAMVADGKAVPVGKVGSGITVDESLALKAELDAAHLPVVEIECLGVTQSGKLRQPVYKGCRSDLTLIDAPLSQLEALPRC